MAVVEDFLCTQGSSVPIAGTLRDAAGNAIVNQYDGTEALSTQIWPGGSRAASFSPATTWDTASGGGPAGKFLVAITGAQTALLYPGTYEGVTRLADAGDNTDACYFTLTVTPGPGGLPAVPTAMTITRLVVEVELIDRDAALLLLCGKSTIADGQNRFLTGALGFALQAIGVTPEIPGVVSDTDLAKVPNSQFFLLCELSDYRLLKNLLNNFAQPDRSAGSTKTSLNAMIERYRQQMKDLETQYASYLSKYKATLTAGSIRVGPAPRDRGWSSWDWREGGGDF
jgi:hypothetical protein